MNYWITTDTHFGHDKMFTEFGTRKEGFEKRILKGFQVVKEDDILIHLGDVSFGNDAEWNKKICSLSCKKWLIRGNHDRHSIQWFLQQGWDFTADSFVINFMRHKILFSHIPIRYTGDNYTINIHGHFHNNDHRCYEPELVAIMNKRQYLLAIENNNYQLFNLKTIIEDFNNKMEEQKEEKNNDPFKFRAGLKSIIALRNIKNSDIQRGIKEIFS